MCNVGLIVRESAEAAMDNWHKRFLNLLKQKIRIAVQWKREAGWGKLVRQNTDGLPKYIWNNFDRNNDVYSLLNMYLTSSG